METASGISVVICCYNSSNRIGNTLYHLSKQCLSAEIPWEVVIVDNNSTDHTANFAKKILADLGMTNYKIVSEPTPGLSPARACGVKHSTFDLILFCDDDNWLNEDYLSIAITLMQSNPAIGVAGGLNEGVLESDQPIWWDENARGYAVGRQSKDSGDITNRKYVWGAGMVIRKNILETLRKTGFQSLLSDRKGKSLSSGGDSEICRWALLMGYKLWYSEELRLKHFISSERLTDDYLKRLIDGHLESYQTLRWYDFVIDCEPRLKEKKNVLIIFLGWLFALRAIILNSEIRKASAQLKVGTTLIVHPTVYRILKLCDALKNLNAPNLNQALINSGICL